MSEQTIFSDKRINHWLIFILSATLVVYFPMLNNGFTNYSDDHYVLNNQTIQNLNWKNIFYLFSSFFDGHYHPLTMISLAVNYKISGSNPFSYQLFNLTFHLINTLLVFILTRKIFKNNLLAIITTLLFGLHPIHVESVARITERKDMLFSIFYFISIWLYLKYLENKKHTFYFLCLFSYILSLISKGQAISLPLTLLLVDFYKNRNLKLKDPWVEKIPFFVLSVLFGILTYYAQKYTGYLSELPNMKFYEPIIHAHYSLGHYIIKLFLPVSLSAHYPYPYTPGNTIPNYLWAYLLITPAFIFVLYLLRKNRFFLFCLLFYIFNIFFMLRIVPVAGNITPDRYNYIPAIGFFLIIGWFCTYLKTSNKINKFILIFISCYITFLGGLSFQRVKVWKNGLTVWNDAVKQFPECAALWLNLGDHNLFYGNKKEAVNAYNNAIVYNKINILTYLSFAKYYNSYGMTDSVNSICNVVDSIQATSSQDYSNKSNIIALSKNNIKALYYQNKAILLNPYEAKAWFNRGNIFSMERLFKKAITDYSICINQRPSFIAQTLYFRSIAYLMTGDLTNAEKNLKEAIEYIPNNVDYKNLLNNIQYIKINTDSTFLTTSKDFYFRANSLFNNNGFFYAIPFYERALKNDSLNIQLKINLSNCYYECGHTQKAIALLKDIKPLKNEEILLLENAIIKDKEQNSILGIK